MDPAGNSCLLRIKSKVLMKASEALNDLDLEPTSPPRALLLHSSCAMAAVISWVPKPLPLPRIPLPMRSSHPHLSNLCPKVMEMKIHPLYDSLSSLMSFPYFMRQPYHIYWHVYTLSLEYEFFKASFVLIAPISKTWNNVLPKARAGESLALD